MNIQWFPGHMHRTRQKLAGLMPRIDVVVEMLDARLPASSANPLLHELAGTRPRLKILNKADLADARRTDQWRRWWRQQSDTDALALAAGQKGNARRVRDACRLLAPQRGGLARPLRVLICGVPNVGKSTLINALLGKKQAATGNEPGITKNEARMVLDDDFYLWDSPGMLWPRIDAPQSAANLAASGAVGRNAYDAQDVALHLLDYLQRRYPQSLSARYRMAHADGQEWLHALARQHSNGDAHQAAERVLRDFRGAFLGRITLETPQEFAGWQAQARQNDLARAEKRQAGKNDKNSF